MKNTDSTVSELTFLFKLAPVLQEMESVDKVWRMLLALATTGRSVGYQRAMLFAVDEKGQIINGRFGVLQDGDRPDHDAEITFEDRARQVFAACEGVESTDLTVRVRSFTVPLAWHRSALVKAARTTYPVLAERELAEYATDPFFNFFDSNRYIAIPLKLNNRVAAVLAADGGVSRKRGAVEDISVLYSLAQQASSAAQNIVDFQEIQRKARVVRKLQLTLSEAKTESKLEEGIRLGLIMLARTVGSGGCLLKDLTRQKTIHIKTVHEYSPEASDDDVAVGVSFDKILDESAAKTESVTGDGEHPLLSPEAARTVAHFRATPLVAGDSVAGALAVYRESENGSVPRPYTAEERSFMDLCAWIIASKLEAVQLESRVSRNEDFLQEVSSNLARERERSRLAERSIDYHGRVSEDLKMLRNQLTAKTPYVKRFPRITEIVEEMRQYSREHVKEIFASESHYELFDVFDATRRIVQDCSSVLQQRGIEVTVRIPTTGPSLLMDKSRITEALENILRATASCLNKGDKLLVECSDREDRVLICFADNSPGLPGDAVSRLVMPFRDTDKGDERKRALSLAGEVIQKHSGEILIKSSMSWKTILILSFARNANKDRRRTRHDRRRRAERRTTAGVRS